MPLIELPNGASAVLRAREELTERVARVIDRSFILAQATATKLASNNFDESNPESWSTITNLTEEDYDRLDRYQAELIVGFVKSWTLGDLPNLDSVYDLPRPVFAALAKACADIYNDVPDFTPDGVVDPLADTAV